MVAMGTKGAVAVTVARDSKITTCVSNPVRSLFFFLHDLFKRFCVVHRLLKVRVPPGYVVVVVVAHQARL